MIQCKVGDEPEASALQTTWVDHAIDLGLKILSVVTLLGVAGLCLWTANK